MRKTAIAVYSPEDPVEAAIQEASHQQTGQWLSMHPCQLMARAIKNLKIFDGWLDEEELLPLRASYFFNPHMSGHQERMVFLTHGLFLRDIIENNEINSFLHDPITLVCVPLAHYLFRDFSVRIHLNAGIIKAENPNVNFITVGGLIMSDKQNVIISESAIVRIDADESVQMIVDHVKSQCMSKAAATEKEPGVFHLDEHELDWGADTTVWHKVLREEGTIIRVDPGETGLIHIDLNGENRTVPKMEFDIHYSLV